MISPSKTIRQFFTDNKVARITWYYYTFLLNFFAEKHLSKSCLKATTRSRLTSHNVQAPATWKYHILLLQYLVNKHLAKLASILVLLASGIVCNDVSSYKFQLSICFLVLGVCAIGAFINTKSTNFATNRQDAFPEAKEKLNQRIKSKRAVRQEKCDLYLPSSSADCKVGFIFIPGALVDSRAYAILASYLSDQGIFVAVLNLEPHRLATAETLTEADVRSIMKKHSTIQNWAIGGHSLGASRAYQLCAEMKGDISKLVMCAGSMPNYGPRIPKSTSAFQIVGSNDTLFWSRNKKGSYTGLPDHDDAVFSEISGGNHSGFGHYGPQTYPMCDGEREISLNEQQRIVVKKTSCFLLGK